jgi:hypothetical protein
MNKTVMKTIYNQRLCGFLQMRGFILVDIKPNKNGNGKNVFFFKETPELLAAIQEYLDDRK